MRWCIYALLSWLLLVSPVFAQGEDPFGGSGKKKNPFGAGEREQEQDRDESRNAAHEKAVLQNENAQLKMQLKAMKAHIVKLEKQHFKMYESFAEREEQLTFKYMSHLAIYEGLTSRLLSAEDEATRKTGLELLSKLDNLDNLENTIPVKLNQATLNVLERLIESPDASIGKLARRAVALHHPRAIELGFQPPGERWVHVAPKSANETNTREKLYARCRFDYFETRFEDVIHEFATDYRVNMMLDQSVDKEKLITFKSSGEPLLVSFSSILDPLELVVCARGASFEILPRDDPNSRVSLVYSVRGLLPPDDSIMSLENLIHKNFGDDGEVEFDILDEYRLLVKATEMNQYRVSKFLATLANGK